MDNKNDNRGFETSMPRRELAKLYKMTYAVFRHALKSAVGIHHGKKLTMDEIELVKAVLGDPQTSDSKGDQLNRATNSSTMSSKRKIRNFKITMTRGELADLYQTNNVTFRQVLRERLRITHSRKLWTKDIERIKEALGDPTKFYYEES